MNCILFRFGIFLWLGKIFQYLIHVLDLFSIQLLVSQSETIFTDDEHKILRSFLFIFTLLDLFEKYVN